MGWCVREDQKRRAIGDRAAVRRHAVYDGSHRMFADPKMQIAPREAPITALGALSFFGRRHEWIEIAESL